MPAPSYLTDTTFTAAVSTRADKVQIGLAGGEGPVGGHEQGMQVLGFLVESTGTGSGVFEVFETEDVAGTETVIRSELFNVTSSAQRAVLANTSGAYLCTIASQETGKAYHDLFWHRKVGTKVYISCVTLTTITAMRIRCLGSRAF